MDFAWVLALGADVVPTPGTKLVRYLEEDLEALQIRLEEDERHRLEGAFELRAAAGERDAPQDIQAVNR
jgi:aryl-alcohol dehydrogenase-like predicted oxidoreductase